MAKKATSSASKTGRSEGTSTTSRTSESGRFVVAKPAAASKRFSDGEIRKAVHTVASAKGARRK
jgi:hypothetical protein